MEPPGGVFGVVDCGMGGGGPPLPVRRCVGIGGGGPPEPVRRCVGIGGGPALPVEDAFDDVRRCVGMGGGFVGDFVGGGAGLLKAAMRAAMAEALPDDLGVFAAAFSFLAASSLAFALAIISATPIFARATTALRVLGHHPFLWVCLTRRRRSFRGRTSPQHRARVEAFRREDGRTGRSKCS